MTETHMISYRANYDTKDGVKGGTITALTSKNKNYIKKRLMAFDIKPSKIYNITAY